MSFFNYLKNFMFFLYVIKFTLLTILILLFASFLSFLERRLLAIFQNRYGPNRLYFFGLFQIFADMLKMLFKENFIPYFSNRFIFALSPFLSICSMLFIFSIIPITENLYISRINISLLLFLIMISISIYSILFAGLSSRSKYSLLGSIRAIAQFLSYEIFLSFSVLGVSIRAGSFDLIDIVNSQKKLWNVIPQFFGFLTFLLAGLAVCHRYPFDQPESEQELIDGYRTEYSGMNFSFFVLSEYLGILIVCSLIVILFFGGWFGFFSSGFINFILKLFSFIIFFMLIRASIPRPKYNHLINFGWSICFPLTLLNLLITAFCTLLFS